MLQVMGLEGNVIGLIILPAAQRQVDESLSSRVW